MIKFLPLSLLLLMVFPLTTVAQSFSENPEKYPLFEECELASFDNKEACFKNTLKNKVLKEFALPAEISDLDFSGEVVVLFEVTKDGDFKIVYINALFDELKTEITRVFNLLPKIQPAQYNARDIAMQFRMPLQIPLDKKSPVIVDFQPNSEDIDDSSDAKPIANSNEYELIKSLPFQAPQFSSAINIPFSHEYYTRFEAEVNALGTNFHSAAKPFTFEEVNRYYDFEAEQAKLLKPAKSWVSRKLWNEHLFSFQTNDYWFTVDFGLDLQVGKEVNTNGELTYNNTRAAIFQGGLGKKLNFYSVIYESQGRFADYFNRYAESIRPGTEGAAVIPGRGIAKGFMEGGYDYPVAEGYLSYSPTNYLNLQLGHGKNFIGDGYRSLLMSDNAAPYPFLKLNTSFWKIKYTNIWMSLRDVRPEVTGEGSYRTKYMAQHYLSYNVSKRLNLGFFESVVWENDNNRGFDFNYLNPVIFYRAIEFSTGAQAGNALIGLTAKYKWSNHFLMYGQWIIDEFSSKDVFGGEGSWKNKHGFQVGFKYFNAFEVDNLYLQLEYNQVRPYTYSHNTITLNYGHTNQSMAHTWGANFREVLAIGRYRKDRYYGHIKAIYGKRGYDLNENSKNYGGDIYKSEIDRPFDNGVKIGQGITANTYYAEVEAGYIINPATNLKVFGNFIFRSSQPEYNTISHFSNETYWFNIGLRTDILNWYFDL